MSTLFIPDMKDNQFPFGKINCDLHDLKKCYIRKRYVYRDFQQEIQLKEKIEKLKNISHKNTINLRSAQDNGEDFIDLFYQYVPIPLEDSFMENPNQTVKDLHKQFIELAIYLAKNFILTSFSPSRCGIILNQDKSILKYYLPLSEIEFIDNLSILERSVQLFNMQSMHYLDTLNQEAMNSTMQQSSQRTFKNRIRLYPKIEKVRRDSQPATFDFQEKKFPKNPFSTVHSRKLSNLSRQLSEISQIYKKHSRVSTRTGSFHTAKALISKYQSSLLKRVVSQKEFNTFNIDTLIERSKRAIKSFKQIKVTMNSCKGLFDVIRGIHY